MNVTKTSTNEYKRRHGSVHWQFCEKLGFNRARLWYEHEPDIVVVDKVKKEIMIIDVAIPTDTKVCDKKTRKDREIHFVKQRNCQIMANEKGRCDSHFSWSIRNYNNKV